MNIILVRRSMNKDKALYRFMIKNHPTIVGWFIHKGIVKKNKGKLFIADKEDEALKIPDNNNCKVYEIYDDGVRRIEDTYGYDFFKVFAKINLYPFKGYSFKTLVDDGFPIFEFNYRDDRYCLVSQIDEIIYKFPDMVLDIKIPKDYKRMKGKYIETYMKYTQNQIDFVRDNGYLFKNYYSFNYNIVGNQFGYSDKAPKKIIDKHGIFANKDIYKYIEWNFDLVERYKDQIMWKELFNESNLIWSDEMLSQYDEYIPYCKIDRDTYCGKFEEDLDYSKFGFLGNDFLDSHKDVLHWGYIFKECKFDWTEKEMTYFSEYALGIDMPYNSGKTTTSSQMKFWQSELISNKNFKWTSNNLLAYLLSNDLNWKELVKEHRPEIFKVFLSIPNIKEIAEPYVKDIGSFWEIVSYQHPFPYDELTSEFTIERIQQNKEEWSKMIKDEYYGLMGDRYHNDVGDDDVNIVITQWDIYISRINIPLTYELAKCLSTIDIKIGGFYVEDYGQIPRKIEDGYRGPIGEDYRFPVINGLEAFSSHHIESIQDMEKIIEDEKIANMLLDHTNNVNMDLLFYTIKVFFSDYSLEEYIDVINQLNDWDVVKDYIWYDERNNRKHVDDTIEQMKRKFRPSSYKKEFSVKDEDWDCIMNDIKIYPDK